MEKTSVSYYEKNAEEYIQISKTFEMKKFYDFVERFLKPDAKILDIGFGSGRDMQYYASAGYDIVGIDGCQNFVDEGIKLGLNCLYSNLPDLTILNGQKFDVIYSVGVIFHLNDDDRQKLFNEIKNSLNDGGVLILSYNELDRTTDQERLFFNVKEKEIDEAVGLEKVAQTIIVDARSIDWITPAYQK